MRFYEFLEKEAKNSGIERIVVGAIITNEKGEIFLAKRKSDDFMGGIYEIPGGKAEKGENIYEALIREVKEETNLDVKKVKSYINYFDYLSGSKNKSRQFNFNVQVKESTISLAEHETYKWIKLNDIESENEITPELKISLLIYKFNKEQNIKSEV